MNLRLDFMDMTLFRLHLEYKRYPGLFYSTWSTSLQIVNMSTYHSQHEHMSDVGVSSDGAILFQGHKAYSERNLAEIMVALCIALPIPQAQRSADVQRRFRLLSNLPVQRPV